MKTAWLLPFLLILHLGACTSNKEPAAPPTIAVPQLISIQGATIRLKATELSYMVESTTILTDQNLPIIDGIQFRLVADTVKISSDNINWVSELIVSSASGKFKFYVKPNRVTGLYRVNAYPIENESIKFDQGLNARFFIDVVAGDPFNLGLVKTESFEDAPSYNSIKDSSEPWIVSVNPDTVSYITVGPISDMYGNLLNDGTVSLTVSQGSILSEISTRVISGYSYFSYKSDGELSTFTATAKLTYDSAVVLTKSELMKKSSPELSFIDVPDFTSMVSGSTRCQVIRLKNAGSMVATNIDLNSSFPFLLIAQDVSDPLCPLTSDTCQLHQSLRSGEICKVRVKFTQPSTSVSDGELTVQASPEEFAGSLSIQKLRTQSVQAAQLVSSNPFISFGGTQCASSRTVNISVTNTGDFDATNLSVQNPPPNTNQTNPFYTIILPPADVNPSSNVNTIINCGNTFPAQRKCRVRIQFSPSSGIVNQALIGKIVGSNINPLMLTVSGYTVPGQALNTFPISFITPNNSILPLGMYLQSNQQSRVDVGPVVDACNQLVSDGSIVTALVTAGTLTGSTIVTNNGYGSFYWNASSSPVDLGTQSITVSIGAGGTKSGSLLFRGVDLQLTGPTEFNQVIEGKSKTLVLTLRNNGNIAANNLSFQTFSPLIITDRGACASGSLAAGETCDLTIKADPIGINLNLAIPVSIQSSSLGNKVASLILSLQARTKAILTLDQSLYLFNDGSVASSYQKTITLTNNGPAISYNTSYMVDAPFSTQSSTCTSTLNVGASCSIIIKLMASDAALAVDKLIKISNEINDSTPSASLGYSSFKFNNSSIKSIIGRCSEAISASMVGSNGVYSTGSSTIINLNSIVGSIFYSSSTCNAGTEISQTQISGGSSVSSSFYVKGIIVGQDILNVSSGAISSAYLDVKFNDELNINLLSPNGLVSNEIFALTMTGGYPSLSVAFVDGSMISSEADIVSLVDVNGDPTGEKTFNVKTISSVTSKVLRVTDSLNFTKDFTINLYPPVYMSSSTVNIRGYSPVSIFYNDYGNPNAKTFKIQRYVSGSFVDGSSYGSSVDSSGNYTPGNGVPTNTTEYVAVSVAKKTGGFTIARTQLSITLEWPFGTLGDLVVESGQTITLDSDQSYDYNSIWVKSGGTLVVNQTASKIGAPVFIGASTFIKIDGVLYSQLYFSEGGYNSYTAPDNRVMTYQNLLSRGGGGGSASCGYSGGGGGGAPFAGGGPGVYGAPGGSTGSQIYGGAGGYDTRPCDVFAFFFPWGISWIGGTGGNSGASGGIIYLKTFGLIDGIGNILLYGNSGSGGGGAYNKCSGPGAAGGGGGGGGGAGGKLFFYSENSQLNVNSNLNPGPGGPGGPNGGYGCNNGFYGSYGANGSYGSSGILQNIP